MLFLSVFPLPVGRFAPVSSCISAVLSSLFPL